MIKERITPDQLDELNFEQKCSLQRFWKPKQFDVVFCTVFETVEMVDDPRGKTVRFMGGNGTFVSNCYPLLSIKQMTEFLERNLRDVMSECSAKEIPEFRHTLGSDLAFARLYNFQGYAGRVTICREVMSPTGTRFFFVRKHSLSRYKRR